MCYYHVLLLGVQVSLLVAIAMHDLRTRTIPNLTLVVAAGFGLLAVGRTGWLSALAGAGAALGTFLLISLVQRGALGEADVKLAGVIGLYAGWPMAVTTLGVGVIAGAAMGLAWWLVRREREFPYAPALVIGAIVVLVFEGAASYGPCANCLA